MSHWVDGQPSEWVDVRDRGLQYGDGCFETLICRDGRLQSLERHLARLQRGLATLGITAPPASQLQAQLAIAAVSEPGSGIVKLIVTRGVATTRGYRPQGDTQATIIVGRYPLTAAPAALRVEVSAVSLGHNPLLAGIKHLNRLEQVLAQRQLGAECDEVIMLDPAGNAVCGSMSNLFVVTAGGLVTPRLDRCGVAGIMRSRVFDGARALSIPLVEAEVPLSQLLAAPGVGMSNVRLGLCPVTRLAGRELPVDERVWAIRHWIDAHAG
jgi:4-amino-4-deoxychorismate lyase